MNILDKPRILLGRHSVFGSVESPSKRKLGPRLQKDYQLVLVTNGYIDVRIGQKSEKVVSGRSILLYPGTQETLYFASGVRSSHLWCSVTPEAVPEELKQALHPVGGSMPSLPEILALLSLALGKTFEVSSAAHGARLDALALAVLWTLAGVSLGDGSEGISQRYHPAVVRALNYIQTRFDENFCTMDLAREVGLSPQHLSRLFKEHLGCSPKDCLMQVRLARGLALLQSTALNVGEVADAVGFKNQFHFSRRMKQHFGQSPLDLKRPSSKQSNESASSQSC